MTVINTLNADTRKRNVEKNTLPSKTIPEQAMTVDQIIRRFTRGLPVDAKNYEAQYHGNVEYPDLKKLDLAEQQELRGYAKDRVAQYKKDIEEQIKLKRQKEQQEFNDWKKAKEDQNNNQSTNNNQSNQGTNAMQTGEA